MIIKVTIASLALVETLPKSLIRGVFFDRGLRRPFAAAMPNRIAEAHRTAVMASECR